MMKIRIDPHTMERAAERGTGEQEVVDVIKTGLSIPDKGRRYGKAKINDFKKERHGRHYEKKRVEVFYVVEGDCIVTVTVYVFYGKWEKRNEHHI